jgi:hypothetical protein
LLLLRNAIYIGEKLQITMFTDDVVEEKT